MNHLAIVQRLQEKVPGLLAVYAFGSRTQGGAGPQSDLDLAIRRERLSVPQSTRDVFTLLHQGGWIGPELADVLKRMVGFRNITVHDYQKLQLPITVSIIEHHLDDFLAYSSALLHRNANSGKD